MTSVLRHTRRRLLGRISILCGEISVTVRQSPQAIEQQQLTLCAVQQTLRALHVVRGLHDPAMQGVTQ